MSGYDVRVIHELRVGNGTDIFIGIYGVYYGSPQYI